ncbi:MAG: hypothetical protein KJT03_20520 [Verrucomicrobiae bacterium]|nr:hypothetical protein [Verrucomicrobiae bacterium]
MNFKACLKLTLTCLIFGQAATSIWADSPNFEVNIGDPLPSEKGLYFERGDAGYLNVRIEEDQFTVLFLDTDKRVIAPENVDKILLFAESVRGDDNRENYLLHSSTTGPAYTHPRYIQKPYQYRVKVRVSTSHQIPSPSTASGYAEEDQVEEFGFSILHQ